MFQMIFIAVTIVGPTLLKYETLYVRYLLRHQLFQQTTSL